MQSFLKPLTVVATVIAASFMLAPGAHAQNNWTGIYIGAHAGVQNSDVNLTNAGGVHFFTNGTEYSLNPSSAAGGLQVEGMYQFNHFVVGGEIAGTAGDFDDDIVAPGPFANDTYTAEISNLATATVKLGYAPDNCSCLAYLRAGYARADIETTASEVPSFNHFGGSDDQQDGIAYGVGYAQRVSGGHLVIGVDYQHIEFDDDAQTGFDNTNFAPYAVNIDAESDMVTARVSWQLF